MAAIPTVDTVEDPIFQRIRSKAYAITITFKWDGVRMMGKTGNRGTLILE